MEGGESFEGAPVGEDDPVDQGEASLDSIEGGYSPIDSPEQQGLGMIEPEEEEHDDMLGGGNRKRGLEPISDDEETEEVADKRPRIDDYGNIT